MKISQHEGTRKDLEGARRLVTGPHLKDDRVFVEKVQLDSALSGNFCSCYARFVTSTVYHACCRHRDDGSIVVVLMPACYGC